MTDLTNGNDTYESTTDGETVNGLGGNDTLRANAPNVTLAGGDGNDIYILDDATAVVIENSGQGRDQIYANEFTFYSIENQLNIEDLYYGGQAPGARLFIGNAVNNRMSDSLDSVGLDTLEGRAGDDYLENNAGVDTLIGGLGNDRFEIANASTAVIENSGEGIDRIETRLSVYSMAAMENVENLRGFSRGGQSLTGNSLGNVITGSDGIDTLNGAAGNDTLSGMGGNDSLIGGIGNDTYQLEDYTTGVSLSIVENAGEGTDTVLSGFASFSIAGYANVERLYALDQGFKLEFRLTGNSLNNQMRGFDRDDVLSGGDGIDSIYGLSANDSIYGGNDSDRLYGNSGNDYLSGGSGSDVLTGGTGRDRLSGGNGTDVFDFNFIGESGRTSTSRDVITGFSAGFDDIDVRNIDASSLRAGNNRFVFIGSQEFERKAGQLRYERLNESGTSRDKTIVEGDVNGDGRADFQIELTGLKSLMSSDFLL